MATALAEQLQLQQQLIAFTKMHGCGNDYVVIDCCHERHPYLLAAAEADDDTAAADWWRDMIRFLCDRRFCVGSDGLMLVAPARSCAVGADVRMIMYNIDGSRARMCGNGIRCVALYHCRNHHHEHEHHDATAGAECCCSMLIDTDSGVRAAQVRPSSSSGARVTIDMGAPSEIANSQSCGAVGGRTFSFTAVTVGNPHCVVFLRDGAELGEQLAWQTLREFDVRSFGPMLEHADFLTERSNIEVRANSVRDRLHSTPLNRWHASTVRCRDRTRSRGRAHLGARLRRDPCMWHWCLCRGVRLLAVECCNARISDDRASWRPARDALHRAAPRARARSDTAATHPHDR